LRIIFLIVFNGLVLTNHISFGQLIDLNGRWKFIIGDNAAWSSKEYDDSDWGTIRVPSHWENEGFSGYDGFAWYRTSFNGNNLDRSSKYYLNLGFIDDADEVYLNGELIGLSGSMPPKFKTAYNSERNYVITNSVINFNGNNVLAVRVFDVVHGGGIMDGDIGIYEIDTSSPLLVDLQGVWEFSFNKNGNKPNENDRWDKIIVPGFWEKQGYWKKDGFGWYRREFELSDELSSNELVLLLGKIDDFDEVYINGRLAGQTRDNRRYGESQSYRKFRVYYLPNVLLNFDKKNTIEVRVEDMGNDGGIYEGPIGITTKKLFEKHFKR